MDNVGLDRLFRATLEGDVGGRRVTAIALGDAQMQERYRKCMLAKARTLLQLKDKTSDLYLMHLSGIEDSEDEELRAIILMRYQLKANEDVNREILPEYLPLPDNATDEEQAENVQAREDEWKRVLKERSDTFKLRVERETERLTGLDHETLVKEATRAQIDLVVRAEWSMNYKTQTILIGTRDNGKPLFNTAEEVMSAPASVQDVLLGMVVEVTAIDPLSLSGPSSTG